MSSGATGVDGVLFMFFSLLVGLAIRVLWGDYRFFRTWIPLPYTVIIFVIGTFPNNNFNK